MCGLLRLRLLEAQTIRDLVENSRGPLLVARVPGVDYLLGNVAVPA
jgi:hypothetical protein